MEHINTNLWHWNHWMLATVNNTSSFLRDTHPNSTFNYDSLYFIFCRGIDIHVCDANKSEQAL